MKEFMDVSRAALRMGAREVHLICLESREEMPAFEEEIEEGVEEGLKLHPSLGPKQFVGKDGKVSGRRDDSLRVRFRCPASLQSAV